MLKIKRLIFRLLELLLEKIVYLSSKFGKTTYLFDTVVSAYNKYSSEYIAVRYYPKNLDLEHYDKFYVGNTKKGEYAIVLQGPICYENAFTYNTVVMYKKIFPEALIIVSTWENEKKEILDKIEKLDVIVLRNPVMTDGGCGNVNRQIFTSRMGVRCAKEHGASYVMKTRTDQRIYYGYAFEYLKSLIQAFPVEDVWQLGQNKRIVFMDSDLQRIEPVPPFFVVDFFAFGTVEDLEKWYAIAYSTVPYKNGRDCALKLGLYDETNVDQFPMSERIKYKIPAEYYITRTYLDENIGEDRKIEDTTENYWKYLKCYMISVAMSEIEVYWAKYDYSMVSPSSWHRDSHKEIFKSDFKFWLSVYKDNIKVEKSGNEL